MSKGDIVELSIFVILAAMTFGYHDKKSWATAVVLLLINHIGARMAYVVFAPIFAVWAMVPMALYLGQFFEYTSAIGLAFTGMAAGAVLTSAGYLSPLASNGLSMNYWSAFSLLCFWQDLVMVAAFFSGSVTIGGKQ
jgi:hypothetical protein